MPPTGAARSTSTSCTSTRTSSTRAWRTRDEDTLGVGAAVARPAHARSRRTARRQHRPERTVGPRAHGRHRSCARRARTACRRSRKPSGDPPGPDQLDHRPRPDARNGPRGSTPTSSPAAAYARLWEELGHVLRLDEPDPAAAWTTAQRGADRDGHPAHRAAARLAALPRARHRPGGRPAAGLPVDRRRHDDRRRHRVRPEPALGGDLHDTRSGPHRRASCGPRDRWTSPAR